MSLSLTFATAGRVLTQLRRDHRTLGMIIVIPCLLVTLIKFVVGDDTWARIGLPLVGIFPLVIMFLITSIAMLRERSSGTLERLMTLPSSKLDILLGYGLAFAAVATVQATAVSSVAIGLLDLDVAGSIPLAIGFAVLNAVLGMALGLLASAFASSEFQAVQFMPAFLLPQIVLCGLFAARDVLVVAGSAVAARALAAATPRRRGAAPPRRTGRGAGPAVPPPPRAQPTRTIGGSSKRPSNTASSGSYIRRMGRNAPAGVGSQFARPSGVSGSSRCITIVSEPSAPRSRPRVRSPIE
jgi:ABC-2 type transport system permease protein